MHNLHLVRAQFYQNMYEHVFLNMYFMTFFDYAQPLNSLLNHTRKSNFKRSLYFTCFLYYSFSGQEDFIYV